ncbi:MAG: FAD-containing oxidoreductase, partial [Pirellulaceae bacterium]
NLTAVGVESSPRGVQVNERLQTTNARIFAAGDVCSLYPFTHAADAQARIVIQNSLFRGRKRWTSLVIPWCTYTTPELAHVGLNEQQAAEQQFPLDTYVQPWSKSDRAILDGEEEGFVKVHVRRGTDRLVGATIVAHHAGDLISELTSGLVHRRGLRQIGRTIHPYPTYGDALAKLADQYNRTRLTPMVRFLFRHWLAWHRR